MIIFYIINIYKIIGFSADSAVRMLYAREVLETKKYFPSAWNYVNRDIWNIDQTTIAKILLVFNEVSYSVNVTVNCPPNTLLYVFVGLRNVLVVPSPKFQR